MAYYFVAHKTKRALDASAGSGARALMANWAIAVFACNEERSIARCLDRILAECSGEDAAIYIVVNGSSDRTFAIAQSYAQQHPGLVFAYSVAFADKSNAWNKFIHELRPDARVFFFVDAYAYVSPGSFGALSNALQAGVNAATAIPLSGRSRDAIVKTMRNGGQLHGSLHALSSHFVERIRRSTVKLPVSLYRGDGLIGAMALYDLDGVNGKYDLSRIALVEKASWEFDQLHLWRWSHIKRQVRRYFRQRRGRYENAAFRRIVRSAGFSALPPNANAMITDFVAAHGYLSKNPVAIALDRIALRDARTGANRPIDPGTLSPESKLG